MSDDANDGASMCAQHPEVPGGTALKLAATDGSQFNTLRMPLIPVACWRLNTPAFAFDSSFVSPDFRGEVSTVKGIVAANPACPAALFGHCDPAGDDALNKTLGDRRAMAIYGLLTRQPDLWAYLYDNPQVGDDWDARMLQQMLAALPCGSGDAYYTDDIDGQYGPNTTAAVKQFQADKGLTPANGQAGTQTRKALFGAYMDWLCTADGDPLSSSKAPLMQPSDFLGGAGATAGDLPKMSLQSCGELNPIILLTSSQMTGPNKDARNAANAPNRRVLLFFFRKGTTVDPNLWPCHRVKESAAPCKKAFWPDGDARRKNGNEVREYKKTHDTMACRFYDRLARRSPCEGAVGQFLYVTAYPDPSCEEGAGNCTALCIADGDGNESFTLPAARAKVEDSGALSWTLDLRKLPTPTTQLFLVRDTKEPIGAPFDPVKLRNALAGDDLDTADATFDPRPAPAKGAS